MKLPYIASRTKHQKHVHTDLARLLREPICKVLCWCTRSAHPWIFISPLVVETVVVEAVVVEAVVVASTVVDSPWFQLHPAERRSALQHFIYRRRAGKFDERVSIGLVFSDLDLNLDYSPID